MDNYSTLRTLADSWGLVGLTLVFVVVVLWAFRPGTRSLHQDISAVPFRNDDRPAGRDFKRQP